MVAKYEKGEAFCSLCLFFFFFDIFRWEEVQRGLKLGFPPGQFSADKTHFGQVLLKEFLLRAGLG